MNEDKNTDSRPMFDAVCADCGQETQVPFEPTGDRPVYCSDCFKKHRQGERQSFDAVCADCGKATTVPFKPTGDKPVYCRECYAKRR